MEEAKDTSKMFVDELQSSSMAHEQKFGEDMKKHL